MTGGPESSGKNRKKGKKRKGEVGRLLQAGAGLVVCSICRAGQCAVHALAAGRLGRNQPGRSAVVSFFFLFDYFQNLF
jgi:hypothetical protein